jgi:hypothetical protein
VCWCFGFGAAGVGVVVTDLWLQICFLSQGVFVGVWCLMVYGRGDEMLDRVFGRYRV